MEILEQQSLEKSLWGNGWAPHGGIHLAELGVSRPHAGVDHVFDGPQGVILGYGVFRGHIAKQYSLLDIRAFHSVTHPHFFCVISME